MRNENRNYTMRFQRILSQKKNLPYVILGYTALLFLIFNFSVNVILKIKPLVADMEHWNIYIFTVKNLLPPQFPQQFNGVGKAVYTLFAVLVLILDISIAYKIRLNFSDDELNYGQKGSQRFTTVEEIKKQYKEIPIKDEFFEGEGGTLISRIDDKFYIDDSKANNLIIGTTRSGKGEMYVFPSIDIYSRAKDIKDRPSMIISDPKLELYRSSRSTLEKRGYKVKLLNLDDPMTSMGYNPLQLVIDYYKEGQIEKAEMAAKTFSFSVFSADESNQEPIWKNTATDLFTAMIVAVTTDCLEADKLLNEDRRKAYLRKTIAFSHLTETQKEIARKRYYRLLQLEKEFSNIDLETDIFLNEDLYYIPTEVKFKEIKKNEKNISCYSCLNFFRELCDTKVEGNGDEGKLEDTALDAYFNRRPPLDYAKSLYMEIKSAGDRTKGSVYINMQSALSVFSLDNIARLTATNEVDMEELGFGEQPVALFIGIPAEDKSNHFIVTSFIAQVYQYLAQLVRKRNNKLDRKLKFILDEAGNFPEIYNFAGFLTICLGLGISFDFYVQAINQIHSVYKDDDKTILENFANQIYIKSIGTDTAEEFSKTLGNKTIIELQRSGNRYSLDKNYTESATERPLMTPHELKNLREGECVILRGIKRTDLENNAVYSYPIINEYADTLKYTERIKLLLNAIKHKGSLIEKKVYFENKEKDLKRLNGNAFLYRYQYLTDTLPNPNDISLKSMNLKTLEHIKFEKMVYDPEEVIRNLKNEKRKVVIVKPIENQPYYDYVKNIIDNKKASLDITGKESTAYIFQVLSELFDEDERIIIFKKIMEYSVIGSEV